MSQSHKFLKATSEKFLVIYIKKKKVKLSSVTGPWGFQQRHKPAEIMNCTDLVTLTGAHIIVSSCLGLWLAALIINREQELSYGRAKENG